MPPLFTTLRWQWSNARRCGNDLPILFSGVCLWNLASVEDCCLLFLFSFFASLYPANRRKINKKWETRHPDGSKKVPRERQPLKQGNKNYQMITAARTTTRRRVLYSPSHSEVLPPSLQALIQLSSSSVNAQEHVCIMAWIGKSKVLFWKLIFLPSTYLGKVPGFEGGMARKECN